MRATTVIFVSMHHQPQVLLLHVLLLLPVLLRTAVSAAAFVGVDQSLNHNHIVRSSSRYHQYPKTARLPVRRRVSTIATDTDTTGDSIDRIFGNSNNNNINENSNVKDRRSPSTSTEQQPPLSLSAAGATTRSYYEILGAEPTDTRDELKRKYIALARLLHPDALIGSGRNYDTTSVAPQSSSQSLPSFSEIASAWKVLSDVKQRKRYDRSLQAEKISQDISNWAESLVTQTVAPAAEYILSSFIRSKSTDTRTKMTPTTTQATTMLEQEPSQSVMKEESTDSICNTIDNEKEATNEMIRKSIVLEQRAVSEYKKAVALQQQLQSIAQERLHMALHTSFSGITSSEALLVLQQHQKQQNQQQFYSDTAMDSDDSGGDVDSHNNNDHHHQQHQQQRFLSSLWRSGNSHTNNVIAHVQDEIQKLQQLEESFIETQQLDTVVQELYNDQIREKLQAQNALQYMIQQQEEARVQYEMAKERVKEQRNVVQSILNEASYTEHQSQKSSYDVERKSLTVEQQSEHVRLALLKYHTDSINNNNNNDRSNDRRRPQQHHDSNDNDSRPPETVAPSSSVETTIPSFNFVTDEPRNANNAGRLQELASLREKERYIAEQSARYEVKAARLLSRSNKLKEFIQDQQQQQSQQQQ